MFGRPRLSRLGLDFATGCKTFEAPPPGNTTAAAISQPRYDGLDQAELAISHHDPLGARAPPAHGDGNETPLEGEHAREPNTGLIKLLLKARVYAEQLASGSAQSLEDIATREQSHPLLRDARATGCLRRA
jgi:hypothetical protein